MNTRKESNIKTKQSVDLSVVHIAEIPFLWFEKTLYDIRIARANTKLVVVFPVAPLNKRKT